MDEGVDTMSDDSYFEALARELEAPTPVDAGL